MTSIVHRAYAHRYAPLAAFLFVVVMGAYGLFNVERQQAALAAEVQARTAAQCHAAVSNRATQLLFGEILIAASTEDGDADPVRERRIDRFRDLLNDRLLGQLPAACDGVMTLPEFRRQARAQVDDALLGRRGP